MKKIFSLALVFTLVAIGSWYSIAHTQTQDQDQETDVRKVTTPTYRHKSDDPEHQTQISVHETNPNVVGLALTTGGTAATTPIINHGGPIMGTPRIYIIWYGNWNQSNNSDTPAGQALVRTFSANIGGSPYFLINQSYGCSGAVNFTTGSNEYTDTGSKGTRLSDANIQQIVVSAINAKWGGVADPNGVYFVLTSSNVSERSGFCTQYCGWHTAATPSVGHIRYSFVGNANRCLNACAAQTTSPNSNAGVDGMISVVAHELEEAASDPDLNAWYDSAGAENADKCAWTFGHFQFQVSNGSWANVTLGGTNFLIQRNLFHNLNNSGKDYCMMNSTQN